MASIALAMIVRDESRCIARCLDSVRPWVDRMLVLDTGSADGTAELARRAGADVHTFVWADDFARARNRALELADADWSVVLDADEWVVRGGEVLAALRDAPLAFAGQLRVDSEFESSEGVGMAPSWLARVLPRGARFEGRIHEQVAAALPRRRLDVHVGHDGYRAQQQSAKTGRNERLLRLALADRPDDPYLHYQLGKDLALAGRDAQAATHFELAYAAGRDADAWRHDLVLRLLFTLKRTARWARAIAVADAQMATWSNSADYHFVLGDLLLDWALAEPVRAGELLQMIESTWRRCLEIGENPDLEGAVQGRGSYLAAKNLAAFHTSQGHAAQALHYLELESQLRSAACCKLASP